MVGMASPIPSVPVSTDLQHCAPMAQNTQVPRFCGKNQQLIKELEPRSTEKVKIMLRPSADACGELPTLQNQ